MLNSIIKDIQKVNKEREANNKNMIAIDDTNEIIIDILTDYFLDEFQNGIDIDSEEFLSSKFGKDYQKIREAEAGIY